MKKKNYLFALFLFGLGIGLFSCNFGNGGNVSNFPEYPAVAVDYSSDLNGILFGTQWGYCVAPTLTVNPGDCVMMGFTIDYDNQPANAKYPLATNVSITATIDQSTLIQTDSTSFSNYASGYTLPIDSVLGATPPCPFYNGRIFLGLSCKDKNPHFLMFYNTQQMDTAGVKNLYLLAQPSSASTSSVATNYAFNLLSLIQLGRDTTLVGSSGNTDCKYILANLNYCTGTSDSGAPIYKRVSGPPLELYIFK